MGYGGRSACVAGGQVESGGGPWPPLASVVILAHCEFITVTDDMTRDASIYK
jgi:hypothetical protein